MSIDEQIARSWVEMYPNYDEYDKPPDVPGQIYRSFFACGYRAAVADMAAKVAWWRSRISNEIYDRLRGEGQFHDDAMAETEASMRLIDTQCELELARHVTQEATDGPSI